MATAMNEQQMVTLREHLDERWRAHQEVHRVERLQLEAAREVIDERLERMNEFREQINRERSIYITRAEVQWMIGLAVTVAGLVFSILTTVLVKFL